MTQTFKVEKAKAQISKLAKSVEDAARKAKEDTQALKELQEMNKEFLTKYQNKMSNSFNAI